MDEKLQKIISKWGIASRRQAEQLILDGRVMLNSSVAHLGQRANPDVDQIEVDGTLVNPINRPQPLYLLLHKPVGIVSTCHDPWQRQTVLELLPSDLQEGRGLHPVGRLDVDSTGALILTNDGDLTFYLTHPRHHIPKTYQVWIHGQPSDYVLEQWRQGVQLSGQMTLPAQVETLEQTSHKTLLEITLREGRNRQIRKVAAQLGHPVLKLHRIAIGPIHLQDLPEGQYRTLKDFEVNFLKSQTANLPDLYHAKY